MTDPLRRNAVLRSLLAETGWSQERLARAVNEAGAEAGLTLRYERSAVSHWLAGRRPWGPVPLLLAEVLSRALDRPFGPADLGMGASGRELDAEDLRSALVRLGQGQRIGAYSLAALAVPSWSQAVSGQPGEPRTGTLRPGQPAAAEQMVAVFSDLDSAFGGGHSRAALAGYLAYDIAPRLHAGGHAAARRGFLSAATRLVYLCGFMCFDDERQDLAQNYYLLALRLAARNGDPAAYAITLRALSVQARTLGQRRPAVHLAETAAAARGIHPAQQAFLFGQVAVAAAADGDRTGALSALTTAERRLQRAGGAADAPMGGYHPAALAHQQAAVRALLGDRTGAITALGTSLRHRPAGERRSRAITTARLAELHLRQGHVEQAVVTWHAFLDDYPQLRSSRATRALATMRSSLRPHGRSPAVARLLRRAASTGSTVPPGR